MENRNFENYEEFINGFMLKLNPKYDINITTKIINDLNIGYKDTISENEKLEYMANVIISYIYIEPKLSKLSTYYYMQKIYNLVDKDYKVVLKNINKYDLLDLYYNKFCEDNIDFINSIFKYDNDYKFDYFGLRTIEKTYTLKDPTKKILECPQHVFLRTAIQIHKPNKELIKETYELMSNLYFTHASPTLFNSGTKFPQLSSCFLLSMPDDLDQMGHMIHNLLLISKHGGGIGLSISDVRPKNSIIKSSGYHSDGIIPMCKVLEMCGRWINQGGRRSGSIAVYIEPWHSDIFDFLELRKAVGDEHLRCRDLFQALFIPDLFMHCVENDLDWYLMDPNICNKLTSLHSKEFEEYYYKCVDENKYTKKIKAKELYSKILEMQFETGQPYMLYKDSINRKSNQKNLGIIKNSNLCAEIVQYHDNDEYAVCNLASICLPKFVKDNKFDFDKLGYIVQVITKNLNNIIDQNYYPCAETKNSNLKHRPIGIGVQGLADTYLKLNYNFDSEDAEKLNKDIFECIYYNSLLKSCELAIYDKPYESFKGSPFSEGLLQFDLWDKPHQNEKWDELKTLIKTFGVRNSLLTTVMPTASTSQIMNNNESIEPYTSNIYVRLTNAGEYIIVNKYLVEDLQNINMWNKDIYNEILYYNGSIQKMDLPQYIKDKYKTAYEIKQSKIIKQSIDRGQYIDQTQSLNLFIDTPDFTKLNSCHFYSWKNGLKTGLYYLRSKPAVDPMKFNLDPEFIKKIKDKNEPSFCELRKNGDETCLMCSS